jgi:hypothetical protein
MEMSEALALRLDSVAAPKPGPAKLSHTHEDIARWLLENPTRPLKECAQHFQYSQSWLSCIIHSDAFQAKLRKLQEGADAVTLLDVPARLRGVASAALDGLAEQVEHALKPSEGNSVVHRDFLLSTAELTLKSLGYGGQAKTPPPAPGMVFQQNNTFVTPVPPDVLARAREKLVPPVEVAPALSETSQLPAGGDDSILSVQRHTSAISSSARAEGPETPGLDL